MKKIIYALSGISTLICANAFAVLVPYTFTTSPSLAYCISNPSSICANAMPRNSSHGKASYDTVTNILYLTQHPEDEMKVLPLQFSSNQLRENLCYGRVAKQDYVLEPIAYCQNKRNSYLDVLWIGQYLPNTQLITLNENLAENHYSLKNGKYETMQASIVGAVLSPK